MHESEEDRLYGSKAAIQSVGKNVRLFQSSHFSVRPLIESILPRDHRDEQHEWRHRGEDEYYETRPQPEVAIDSDAEGSNSLLAITGALAGFYDSTSATVLNCA